MAVVQPDYWTCIPGDQKAFLHSLQMRTGVQSSRQNETVTLQGVWEEMQAAHDILNKLLSAPSLKVGLNS